ICSVPFRGGTERGVVVETRSEPGFSGERKPIREVLSEEPLENTIMELARWLTTSTFTPLGQVFKRMVPYDLSVSPRTKKFIKLASSFAEIREFIEKREKRAPKQVEILEQLLTADGPVEKQALLRRAESSRSPLKSLVEKEIVEEITLPQSLSALDVPKGLELPDPDPAPVERLNGPSNSFEEIAIYGSGEERLAGYLGAITSLTEDGSVLVLAPNVLRSRELSVLIEKELDVNSLTYNSELTDGELAERWQLSRSGQVDVVVGVLNAIYLPLSGLKGILIEDEGSRNYDLKEQDPKGNLVEIAIKRGRIEDVPVILGGRTPSVNSYYRLKEGELRSTGNSASCFPSCSAELELVSSSATSSDGPLSEDLLAALGENYGQGNPALIIGERAGPSTAGICRECGTVLRCSSCQVPLAYSSSGNYGVCPYCGKREDMLVCQDCGSDEVKFIGGGLEEAEEELSRYLPEARVYSYDFRSANWNDFSRVVDGLLNGDLDILLGTTVIGSLFLGGKVPLVGLLDLDIPLNRETYRSTEFLTRRIFQGCELVKPGGRVFLQGLHGDQVLVGPIRGGKWGQLYDRELESRKLMGYPPYRGLVEIEVRGSDRTDVRERIDEIKRNLGQLVPKAETLGPTEKEASGTSEVSSRHYLMVKTEELSDLLEALRATIPRSESGGIRLNPHT
ncbi:hypothetical protein KGY71_07460, partial [Candidatus Bipolaricaulota bacterium]|nr:hypothetical protein [Candidatus Bipolaricaulota bacterium]